LKIILTLLVQKIQHDARWGEIGAIVGLC